MTRDVLHSAVRSSKEAFASLADGIDAAGGAMRPSMRSNLDLQVRSLQVLDEECAAGAPRRRIWSLGQAALPVLSALLNAAAKPKVGVDPALLEHCRSELDRLNVALTNHAEGR